MSLFLVLAQAGAVAVAPAAAAPVPSAASQGVTNYPQAFFSDYRPSTALDMVNRLPGFSLDTGDDVRGFEGAAGNVLIDGARPTSKSDRLDNILQRIPASQVDHIELIRGGAPGVDMQGKSVLANVVRVKGGGFTGLAQLNNRIDADKKRNYPGIRLEGSGDVGEGKWEAGLRSSGGYDNGVGETAHVRVDPNGALLERSAIESHGESVNSTLTGAYERPLGGGKFRINGRAFYDNYRYNEVNSYSLPIARTIANDDGQARIQSEIGLRYDRDLGARTKLELIGLRQTDDADYHSNATLPRNDYNYRQHTVTTETIGRGVLKFRRDDRLSLEAGAEGAYNTLDNDTELKVQGVSQALPAPQAVVTEKRGELFTKVVWAPVAGWTLEGGMRGEASRISGHSDDGLIDLSKTLYYPKPRLQLSWEPRGGTQVRARFEREVGQLNFNDFVSSAALNEGVIRAGNVDLVPEQAWVSEIGLEQRFWTSGAIVLTLRHYAISDTIDRALIHDPVAGDFDAPANIGKATKDTVDLNLNMPLDRLWLKHGTFRGSVQWRRSAVDDPTTGESRPISGLRHLEWEAHYSQQLPAWKTEVGVDAFGGWRNTYYRFNEISTDKLRTFVAVYAEYKPKPDLLFRIEVNNVTSRGFKHIRKIYDGPRGAHPLLLIDDREAQIRPLLNVLVRKTFGG